MSDAIRIRLLEYVGWTDLTRQRKFSMGALKGTSPDGKEDQFAPNPCVSLDSMAQIESFAANQSLTGESGKAVVRFARYLLLLDHAFPFGLAATAPANRRAEIFCRAIDDTK